MSAVDRTKSSELKLQKGRFRFDTRKILLIESNPLPCLALFREVRRSPSCRLLLSRLPLPLTAGSSACCSHLALQKLPASKGVVSIALSLAMIDCFNFFS